MEWKEEKGNTILVKDGVVCRIKPIPAYELGETDSVEYRYQLTIEKSNVYSYGKGSGIVSNNRRAKILHSFIELCGSFGEAKAKAEELLPLFESIG